MSRIEYSKLLTITKHYSDASLELSKSGPLHEAQKYRLDININLACEQALLFGRAKRVSRERASERRVLARLAQIGELARRLT